MSDRRVPVRPDLATIDPYGAPQLDVEVRLNTNETPFPPPAAFFDRLSERTRGLDLHRYPDRRAWELRTALAKRFGLYPERVWAAKGSNEVLLQLFQAYGGSRRRVLLFRPGYSMFPLISRITLTDAVHQDLDARLRLEVAAAERAVADHDPDIICVASPSNPTGLSLQPEVLHALHDGSRALVILDEAYQEFAPEPSVAIDLLDALPRLVISRTFSKAWRLAGARLGYLLAHDWVIDDLRRVRLPYHLDALAQAAGLTALDMADEMTTHIGVITAERDRVHRILADLPGVEVWPSSANFLLMRTGVDDLFDRLLERGVLVRDFSSEPLLEGCLRVTVGAQDENDRFLDALTDALGAETGARSSGGGEPR